jgi:cytochrome P450
MTELTILVISISLVSLIFYYYYRLAGKSTTRKMTPCPHSYPIIGNIIALLRNIHRFHDWIADMLSTTTTIQANGFLNLTRGICTVYPPNIHHILRSNFSNYIKGDRFRSVLSDLLGDGIFNADGDLWSLQRKIASHEFNTRSLKSFISSTVASQISNRLIPCLSAACDNNQILDLQEVLTEFSFNNICNVAFGVDPATNPRSSDFVRAFDFAIEGSLKRVISPLHIIWKVQRFLNIGSQRKYREAIQLIDEFTMNIITTKEMKRNEESEYHKLDLLSRFMDSTKNLDFSSEAAKRKFLRDIVISFILAGKDSTSTALTWFFWLIAGHPKCERLIYNEIEKASGKGSSFNYDELKELNYLHAALSESMRLFPPVPINSKLTVDDDVLPDGTHVSKGWFADYSAYAMGRNKNLWGEDCREFKPERWLDDEGVYQPSDQFKYPVFHCGPRICLGKDMAYVQMKCVAAAVLYEFEIEAVDGGGCTEAIVEPPYVMSLLLKKKDGLRVRLRRRQR